MTIDLPILFEKLNTLEKKIDEIRELVGPFGVAFADGTTLVQTLFGNKYFIDSHDLIMAPQLIVYRQWEPDISTYLYHNLKPETWFVDVGANFGYFTCLAASRIGAGPCGGVIAIEPNPKNIELLKRNVRINWSIANVFIEECAATESPGIVDLYIPAERGANASLAVSKLQSGMIQLKVPSRTIDEIVGERLVHVMKIDVEGFEYSVLLGALETLNKSNSIELIIEWSPSQMAEGGQSSDKLIDLLVGLGFSPYRIPNKIMSNEIDWNEYLMTTADLRNLEYANILWRR